jgi:hypothetical protein
MSTPEVYRELESSAWNEISPFKCPCRNGWLLSDFDTWHRCKTHGVGVPHPDPDSEDESFDMGAHHLKICREAFVTFRTIARKAGLKGSFNDACLKHMTASRTPKAWLEAAEKVAEYMAYHAEEERAASYGYSCALEMRQHEDAMIERAENER